MLPQPCQVGPYPWVGKYNIGYEIQSSAPLRQA